MPTPRIGVVFHPSFPPETLPGFAQRAEAAGFDELWLWGDCFMPGALTAATIALASTQQIKVGIGLLPATTYNPLFAAMEFTTLARTFPNRFLPGYGYGVSSWMTQIGAAPRSYMRALTETVTAVRQLLAGELVTMQGEEVQLDQVQMRTVAEHVLPIYIGAMRTKTLQLAGRIGDGTILTAMSSPAYVRWAWERIRAGMAEVGRTKHELVVYLDVKVGSDGAKARAVTRQTLAARMPWVDAHVDALGIGEQVAALTQQYGPHEIAEHIPDAWVDGFTAAGTPEHVIQAIQGIIEAGADSVVFQPLEGDPDGLDEYIEYLMPHFKLKQ